ncbi:hypothetical protein IV102_14605 [bacterium]|nr:hypothetical protein [bacterium]
MRKTQGTAVFTILLVGSLLAAVFFVTAALVSVQLGFVGHQSQRQSVRNLAESAVALAIARLVENPDFGRLPGGTVQVPGLASDCYAGVSFDGLAPNPQGLPVSVNNLKRDQSVQGAMGAVLPPHSAQILALGASGQQRCRLEVILHVPRYPYQVASSGPIRCSGSLLVAAVKGPAALAAGTVQEEDLEPGMLACNSLDVGGVKSVKLEGSGIRVVGDVQSVGGIELDSAVTVSGEVRANSSTAPLPAIPLRDFDTAGKPGLVNVASSSSPVQIKAFSRHQGKLTLGGGLELQNGVLFVDGDLEVRGGIQGQGAVIVTGNTTVSGGGSLGTQSVAALLSGGSLTIEGSAAQSASFQGMVYSGKKLATRYADVAGLLVCNDPTGQGSVSLENSRVLRLPEASDIHFSVQPPATPGSWQAPATPLQQWAVPVPAGSGVTLNLSIQGLPYYNQSGGAATAHWEVKASDPCISSWDLIIQDSAGRSWHPGYFHGEMEHYENTGNTQRQALQDGILNVLHWQNVPTDAAYVAQLDTYLDAQAQVLIDLVQAKVDMLNAAGTVPPAPAPGTTTAGSSFDPMEWSLDLSRFMNLSDQIRIQQWREI